MRGVAEIAPWQFPSNLFPSNLHDPTPCLSNLEAGEDAHLVYNRVRPGFEWNGKVVRPELVKVFGPYTEDNHEVSYE